MKAKNWGASILQGGRWLRELKRLDWRRLNREAQKDFRLALYGSEQERDELTQALGTLIHPLSSRLKGEQATAGVFDRTCLDGADSNVAPLFGLSLSSDIPETPWPVYRWPKEAQAQKALVQDILDHFPAYQLALAAKLPRFRGPMMEREVMKTVHLNTTWVTASALPNLLPGPHQLMTAPLEASSDFVVLTLNEIHLMMSLTAIVGLRVHPKELFTQAVIVLSMAKLAQMSATQLLSKLPAGAGLVAKGAVAYAFTRAIGEAIILYLVTGRAQGRDFFTSRIDVWFKPGIAYIRQKIGKKD